VGRCLNTELQAHMLNEVDCPDCAVGGLSPIASLRAEV